MTTALEGGEGSASRTPPPVFTPGKTRYPFVQALGPVWTGVENLAPTGIRSPDRPVHSQSLLPLRYPAHFYSVDREKYFKISEEITASSFKVEAWR